MTRIIIALALLLVSLFPTKAGELRETTNVAYARFGEHEVLLDWYRPDDERVYPGIVLIHGGGWIGGSRTAFASTARDLARKGFVVANIDYRLATEAPFPGAVLDCKAAVRWMRAHAEELKVDPGKIAVIGGSAGGHLAAMVATTHGNEFFSDEGNHSDRSDEVQAAVIMGAGVDQVARVKESKTGSIRNCVIFFEGEYDEVPERYAQGSPITHLSKQTPPILMLDGEKDRPGERYVEFRKKLDSFGVRNDFAVVPGAAHGKWAAKEFRPRFVASMVAFLDSIFSPKGTRVKPERVAPKGRKAVTPPPTKPPLEPVVISELPDGMERLDLYLLMGQSNMKGRGVMPEEPLRVPRIVMMHKGTDRWFLARHPLHLVGDPETFKGHDNAGVGPGLSFARSMAEKQPGTRIGLIPCAVGGSPMRSWQPGAKLYEEAMRRARLALEQGPEGKTRIAGAFWLQGEADARPEREPVYAESLNKLVDGLRSDLDIPNLPFIGCTILELREDVAMRKRINELLLALPDQRPCTACVDARDLKGHIGDLVHIDTPGQEEIGRRFARRMIDIQEGP